MPISVSMPEISAAIDSGIISRPVATCAVRAMRSTIGMKIATTPVEDMMELSEGRAEHQEEDPNRGLGAGRDAHPCETQSPMRWG